MNMLLHVTRMLAGTFGGIFWKQSAVIIVMHAFTATDFLLLGVS